MSKRKRDAILLLKKGSFKENGLKTFSVKQLHDEKTIVIDPRYQRAQMKDAACEICAALENGGVIPDPAWVSKRADGTYAVIDGQQRYWGSYFAGVPLRAKIYIMNTPPGEEWRVEREIFHILNNRKTIVAPHRALYWPNAAGELLRSLNDDGPLKGRISSKTSTCNGMISASTLVRMICCAMSGKDRSSNIKEALAFLDRHIVRSGRRVKKTADGIAFLVSVIWGNRKTTSLACRALGVHLYSQWAPVPTSKPFPMPTAASLRSMKSKNWKDVTPSQESRFMPVMLQEVESRWKTDARKKKAS